MATRFYIAKTLGTGAELKPFYNALSDYGEASGIDGRPDPTQQAGRWIGMLTATSAAHAQAEADGNILAPFFNNSGGYLGLDALVSDVRLSDRQNMATRLENHGFPIGPIQGSWSIRETLAYIARLMLFRQWMRGQGIPAIVEGLDVTFGSLSVARRNQIKDWLFAKGFDPSVYGWTGSTKIRKALSDIAQELIHEDVVDKQGRWRIPMLGYVHPKSLGIQPSSQSYSDNFTYSDGELETVSSGAWVKFNTGDNDLDIDTNQVVTIAQGGADYRFDSALDTDDHESEGTFKKLGPTGGHISGPTTRQPGDTTITFYWFFTSDLGGNHFRIRKVVTGSHTNLGSSAAAGSLPRTVKGSSDGTTQKIYDSDVEKISLTDASISGNNYAGITLFLQDSPPDEFACDDWSAADLAAAAVSQAFRYPYHKNLRAALAG